MKYTAMSFFLSIAVVTLASGPARAQLGPVTKVNPEQAVNGAGAAEYWTAERFKAAKPLPLPQVLPGAQIYEGATAQPSGKPASSDAQAPSEGVSSVGRQLFAPDAETQSLLDAVVAPQANGTFNAPYTSSRVFPLFTGANAGFSADRAYPYRTVGKLFFSIGASPFVCSASVIQRRVVVTAGHCVHSGTASGFHSNWVFVPAFRDGGAPLGQWRWRMVTTTGTWAGGGGGVPNAADYAMISFADQRLNPNGPLLKLGNVTGWLGWQTLSLNGNHTSKLGYPCNLDNCQKMQIVTSQSFRATSPNNVEYGSDARGGSSGGPWVQNFGESALGGDTGSNTGRNRVVGVTSYGYVNTDPKVQGASIPDSRWVQLWNVICGPVGNCN